VSPTSSEEEPAVQPRRFVEAVPFFDSAGQVAFIGNRTEGTGDGPATHAARLADVSVASLKEVYRQAAGTPKKSIFPSESLDDLNEAQDRAPHRFAVYELDLGPSSGYTTTSMTPDFDVVVIGAGVIGLACAAVISRTGRSVLVIERRGRIGEETSSRSSGVIHAGIYYPAGSLKAALCVQGRRLLYRRCVENGIPHRKLGKLVVAGDESEISELRAIQERARRNGVELALLEGYDVRQLEPALNVNAALWSPESGIVAVRELIDDYQREATEHHAILRLNTRTTSLHRQRKGWAISTESQNESERISADWVINAAGLSADRLAATAGLDVEALGWRIHWCKGDYFALSPRFRNSIAHLIYPVPVHAGLGIHLTLDLSGNVIAGPDTEYVDRLDYDVSPGKVEAFAREVRRYLPNIEDSDLAPAYSGIRPKLQGPSDPVKDFVVDHQNDGDFAGLINLIGIESPGLTASEALAHHVCHLIENH
jgi:L-2-hydroxyglutarate oxidase LhgO